MRRLIFVLILLLTSFYTPTFAQDFVPVNFPYAHQPLDARAIGLGQHQVTLATLSNGLQTNPGALGFVRGIHMDYNHTPVWPDLEQSFMAGSYNVPRLGTFAFGYAHFDTKYQRQIITASDQSRKYSLGYGSGFLNILSIGLNAHYHKMESTFNDIKREYDDWYIDAGLMARTPLLRFYVDLLEDEFRAAFAFNQLGREDWETQNRFGLAYEISPVIFFPSLDSHVRIFHFTFAYESISRPHEIFSEDRAQAMGLEIGVGEIFFYRLGNYTAHNGEDDNTHGIGFRLPLDILTNDEWPIRIGYDRACPPFTDEVAHSFKIDVRLTGKLAL